MKKAKKRLIITSLLITILIVAFLFSGCSNVSKYAKSKSEKASGESAVVDNTSTVGIAKTLTKQKRTDIVMVGFDMAEETKQFIKDPDYRGVSLMQKQDQMGYLGIGTLNSLINGKKSEQKYFDTGVIMIDSDYLMEKGVS